MQTVYQKNRKSTLIFRILFYLEVAYMKIKALILFFPFAVFLVETVSFASAVNNLCKKENVGCGKMSCMKMKKRESCQSKKQHDQKPAGKCNDIPGCSTCPVCFAFTFLSQYEWSAKSFLFKKNYRLINASDVSSYIPPVWKPPNDYFLYS